MKLQRSGRNLECITQWECILGGGCMTRGKRAPTRGPLRASLLPDPSSPFRATPANGSTTALTGAPQGSPPSATAHFRTALGAMGIVRPQPVFEVSAFLFRS